MGSGVKLPVRVTLKVLLLVVAPFFVKRLLLLDGLFKWVDCLLALLRSGKLVVFVFSSVSLGVESELDPLFRLGVNSYRSAR